MGRWSRVVATAASMAALVCTSSSGYSGSGTAAEPPRPDIVVVMVDDLAEMDDRLLSVLPTISSTFLQHGIRFTDYIGNNPLCCPGRSNFLTGQYSHHHGVIVNDARLFDPRETVATELQGVGYQTFIAGKYLNGTSGLTNKMPPGWTEAFVEEGQYRGGPYWLNGKAMYPPGYSTDLITNYAKTWIRQAKPAKPIFLMLTPSAPHQDYGAAGASHPFEPSPPARYLNVPRCRSLAPWKPPNYAEADVSDKPAYVRSSHAYFPNGWPLARTCGAMLAVDDQLAQVKAAMAAAGRTNTLYLFTSDNGMTFGTHGLNTKATPYATPMPLFVRWDSGAGPALRTISTTLSNVDVAPTLCALAGCRMGPYPNGFGVDGISFAPLLRRTATGLDRQVVLVESPGQVDRHIPRWYGVRTTNENTLGRWEYTEYETGECELYDLAADPWELTNRCNTGGSYQDIQAKLDAALNSLRHDAPGPACTSACYVDAFNGNDANGGVSPTRAKQHIQAAIDAVRPGGVIHVTPGHYREQAKDRSPATIPGTYDFGLFVPVSTPGISIMGVDYVDQPIFIPSPSAMGALADITTIGDASFGPVGVYVDAPHVRFQGLVINGNLDPGTHTENDAKTFYVAADDFTLSDSKTTVPGGGSIWFDDPAGVISRYHILRNHFLDGTTIDITDRTGTTGGQLGRVIKRNTFKLGGSARPAISFTGAGVQGSSKPVGGATIDDNTFSGRGSYILARGTVVDAEFNWIAWFNSNVFDGAVIVGPNPRANDLTGYDSCGSNECPNTREITATIQRQIMHGQSGDTVYVKAGTYAESPDVTKSVTVESASGRNATTIALDTGPTELGSLLIDAPNVTVDGFTIVGRDGTPSRAANANIIVAAHLESITIENNRLKIGRSYGAPSGDEGTGILTTGTTASDQFLATLAIRNNLFQPLHGSAVRAWAVKPGVTDLTISGNTVSGAFNATAMVQAASAVVSNNTIVGSGSSASVGAWGYLDPDLDGHTMFEGNDISGTNIGIVVREANDVTITNNLIHGVVNGVVLSDPGDFTSALVGTSVHVNDNSITGASGNLLVNSYPDPVDASGNWWGTKAEASIDDATSGPIDFTPFLERNVDVGGAPGFQGDHATVLVTARRSQTGSARRLEEAIDLVDPSGTVVAGPGAFPGDLTIAKSVTLQGAQLGDPVGGRTACDPSESCIEGTVMLAMPDILVDGFSITEVATADDPAYGVIVQSGASGATLSHDLFDTITTAGAGKEATAIHLQNGPDDVTITENQFSNISGSLVHAIAIDGSAQQANVRFNAFYALNATDDDAVAVWFDDDDALAYATVTGNNLDIGLSGYGIAVGTASPSGGSVNGACNWWGDESGPGGAGSGIGSKVSLNVTFDPWLTDSALDSTCVSPP